MDPSFAAPLPGTVVASLIEICAGGMEKRKNQIVRRQVP